MLLSEQWGLTCGIRPRRWSSGPGSTKAGDAGSIPREASIINQRLLIYLLTLS